MYNKALSAITIAVVTVLSAQLSIPTADFFGIEDDASGYSGTCVLIPVNITNVQSGPIQTIIFNILYNNSVINVVAAHKGTLTSGPCEGTGGHTEYVRIWNNHILNATAKRDAGDWHNISFNKNFTLVAGETYYYTIRTGSYPQIIHNETFTDGYGTIISCDKFVDANGRVYYDWIPAIKLFGS